MKRNSFFSVDDTDPALVVTLLRNLGTAAETEMREDWREILGRVERESITKVIIDFGKVEYFGSLMLESIVQLGRSLKSRGGHLILCNLSTTGAEILNVARFDKLYPITACRKTAMEAVSLI